MTATIKKKVATAKKAVKSKPIDTANESVVFEEPVEEPKPTTTPPAPTTQADPALMQKAPHLAPAIQEQFDMPVGVIHSSLSRSAGAPKAKKEKPTSMAIPHIKEQFDMNSIVAAGVIHSVWGNQADVFARIALSHRGNLVEDDAFASYATLRFADGMIDSNPISIQPGDVVKVQGYLTHREYNETLRKFLDDARSMNFFDLVDASDLSSWRSLSFKRQNGVVNVLAMSLLDREDHKLTQFGEFTQPEEVINRATVEGVVARVWEYRQKDGLDIFIRLAVYDEHTPLDTKRTDGNFGRLRRKAHYITVRFPCGKTSSGSPVRLKPKMRVRLAGELRDKGQVVTLHDELLRTGMPVVAEMMGRVSNAERMSEITSQQESLHILANAVIVYSASNGSRRK